MSFQTPCKKVSFSDEESAEYYIEKLQRTSKRKKKPVRSYLCEKCFNWHLTSKRKNQVDEPEVAKLKQKIVKLERRIQHLTNESNNKTKKIKKFHDEIYDLNRRLGRTHEKDRSYSYDEVRKYLFEDKMSWERKFRKLEEHHLKEMGARNDDKG